MNNCISEIEFFFEKPFLIARVFVFSMIILLVTSGFGGGDTAGGSGGSGGSGGDGPGDGGTSECAALLKDDSFFEDFLNCMVNIEKKLNLLRRDLNYTYELQTLNSIPSGAILMFQNSKNTGCPNGWTLFTEGDGRFLLGTSGDRSVYRRLELGGEATVVLTLDNLPTHTHQIIEGRGVAVFDQRGGVGNVGGAAPSHLVQPRNLSITQSGGGLPHNNMPPYIALLVCKKQ